LPRDFAYNAVINSAWEDDVMDSLRGHFLVGSPYLSDPNFFRSVVLMIQHDEGGALGLVLTRPTDRSVADVWEMVTGEASACERAIYLGGPVAGPLMALHVHPEFAEADVVPGVYFSTQKDAIEQIVADEDQPWLLFSGYSGWGAGQLENELKVGGWLTVPAHAEDVFHEGDELWERLVSKIGQDILAPAIRASHVPPDPSCN
jgi:putative transcriptional regulator